MNIFVTESFLNPFLNMNVYMLIQKTHYRICSCHQYYRKVITIFWLIRASSWLYTSKKMFFKKWCHSNKIFVNETGPKNSNLEKLMDSGISKDRIKRLRMARTRKRQFNILLNINGQNLDEETFAYFFIIDSYCILM